jgi:phosphoribosylformimino-5-aminoimidazole carboxamide ribotide isomerase
MNCQILPAIDLMDGGCVRLRQGRFDERTDYAPTPLAMARLFERMGYEWLHIIDLDGARAGVSKNFLPICEILEKTSLKVQVGGGLRSFSAMADMLNAGVSRVLVGSAAVKDPEVVREVIERYGSESVVAAMDLKEGKLRVSGWTENGEGTVDEFIGKMFELGVRMILCTDISRDGMEQGPNVELYEDLVQRFPQIKWIAAGGVGLGGDRELLDVVGISQAVVGKAFYEGSLLAKRIVPCLDVRDGRVVKGISFEGLKDVGNPVELAQRYQDDGADELVFLDITATSENRDTVVDLASRVAKVLSIPFTVGGGIRSLDDIREVLRAGADKVGLESAAVLNPDLISEAVAYCGSQAIVISVSPKRISGTTRWTVMIKGGKEDTGVDLIEFLKDMQARGAGEILLNSVDEDGRKGGYDLELLRAANEVLRIPFIASSGAGKMQDFYDGLVVGGADAVLAASVFHSGEIPIPTLKHFLNDRGVPIRLT